MPSDSALSDTPNGTWFEKNSKKALLLTNLLVFLSIPLIDTVATRFYFRLSPEDNGDLLRTVRIRSKLFHHTLAPNKSILAEWGHTSYRLTTNSLGFRDREMRAVPLSSAKMRLLFLGDSFLEAMGYDYDQTFLGIVGHQLAKRNIRTLNASVASYSPTIYNRKIKYLIADVGLKVDHVFIFLDISDIRNETEYFLDKNDRVMVRGDDFIGANRGSSIPRFIAERTTLTYHAIKSFQKLLSTIRSGPAAAAKAPAAGTDPDQTKDEDWERRHALNNPTSLWTIREVYYREFGIAGLESAKKSMDALHHLLSWHNIKLSVAVYPWPDQVYYRDLESRQVTFWREWADAKNVGFIDFFPYFINNQDSIATIERYFIPYDMHWNQAGHALMARNFLMEYEENPSGRCGLALAAGNVIHGDQVEHEENYDG